MAATERLLIIGLDGATFDLIAPWARAGKLPHLARLMEAGTWAPLGSTLPPMTFPAWTTFMTGQNVGKHGIFDFTERKQNSYQVQFTNGGARKAETMWSVLSRAGKRLCILGVPCTYPPEPINGVMISGFDSPGAGPQSMYPPGLFEELRERVGEYIVSPDIVKFIDQDRPDLALASILRSAQRKAETALYLLRREPWDCFMVMFGESDSSAHHFWKYHDPASPHHQAPSFANGEDPLETVYRRLDEAIGALRAAVPPDTTTIVVSDHGHGGTGEKIVYVNRWLAEQGLLAFRTTGTTDAMAGLRLALTRLGGRAKMVAARLIPRRFRKLIIYARAGVADKVESFLRFSAIDWNKTQAFSEETPYYPTIWINVRGREPQGIVEPGAMYEAVRAEIMARLLEWRDPHTGRNVVKAVFRREDVYHGPCLDRVPDLLVSWNLDGNYSYLSRPTYLARSRQSVELMSRDVVKRSRYVLGRSGSHRDHGILIMAGRGIVPGATVRQPRIEDLAPTILSLLGVRSSTALDGRVLQEALEQVAEAGALPPVDAPEPTPVPEPTGAGGSRAPYSEQETLQIESRLKDLGYIE